MNFLVIKSPISPIYIQAVELCNNDIYYNIFKTLYRKTIDTVYFH